MLLCCSVQFSGAVIGLAVFLSSWSSLRLVSLRLSLLDVEVSGCWSPQCMSAVTLCGQRCNNDKWTDNIVPYVTFWCLLFASSFRIILSKHLFFLCKFSVMLRCCKRHLVRSLKLWPIKASAIFLFLLCYAFIANRKRVLPMIFPVLSSCATSLLLIARKN